MNLKKLKKVLCLALSAFIVLGEAGSVTTMAAETETAQEECVEEEVTEATAELETEEVAEAETEEATEEVAETETEEATEEVAETETEEVAEEVAETEIEEATEEVAETETEEAAEELETTTATTAVTGLKQTSDSTSSVQVQWNASGLLYSVEWSSDKKTWVSAGTTSSAYSYITNLSAGKRYYVRVYVYGDKTTAATIAVYTRTKDKTSAVKQVNDDTSTTGTTVTWSKVSGANGYKVEYRPGISGASTVTKYVTTNKISLTGLKKNTYYYVYVYAYKGGKTYKAVSDYGTSQTIKLKPTKVTGVSCECFWTYSGAEIAANTIDNVNGYHYIIYKYNSSSKKYDKKVESGTTSSSTGKIFTSSKVAPGQFYVAKVRAYTTINNKNVYGSWSDGAYFTGDPKSVKIANASSTSQKVSWSGVKGATSYTVYVSTKQGSRGEKVATTSKKALTCSKYNKKALKKGKTYYYTIVVNMKVGNKTYKSTPYYQYYLQK